MHPSNIHNILAQAYNTTSRGKMKAPAPTRQEFGDALSANYRRNNQFLELQAACAAAHEYLTNPMRAADDLLPVIEKLDNAIAHSLKA